MLRHLDRERAHREQIVDVLLRDFAAAIDLIGIDVRVQIFLQLREEWLSRRLVLRGLIRERKDAIELELPDEKVARETAAFIERIA